mmetsp:Transcript_7749/g.17707  ORF Transcript_7749/g.17707 Transcript_7749/m.17707 type:complete len:229 (-) Transcript_7749:356-1042(-)
MPGGTACTDDDAPGGLKTLEERELMIRWAHKLLDASQVDVRAAKLGHDLWIFISTRRGRSGRMELHAAAHAVLKSDRLFHDLLQHEVLVASLLDLIQSSFELNNGGGESCALGCADLVSHVAPDHNHLTIVEVHNMSGVLQEGRGVACNKPLLLSDPEDERASESSSDENVRVVPRANADAVGTHYLAQGLTHSLFQAEAGRLHDVLDEFDKDLSVRLRHELVALAHQ